MARNDVYLNINALSPADAVVTGQQDMTAATVPELVLGDTPTFNFYFTDNTNVWPSWAGNASYTLTWALSDAVAGDFAPAATTGNATPITGGWSVILPLNSYDLVGLLNTKRVGQPYPVQNLWQQLRVTDPSGNEVTRAMFWTPVRYRAISDTQNTESASPTGGRFVTVNNVNTLTTPTAAQFYAANPVPTSALGTAANGELLIGNGTGFTKSTLTAGTGITVTNGSGSITIDASGAQELLTATVKNAESVAITKGQVVYLFAATGGFPSVKLAYNTTDATSAKTFGVVSDTSIAPNGTGTVTCVGVVDGLNLGAYQDGDTVYLGDTPGSFTATKPYAPNHLVYVGIIERANAGNGELYVRVQNGYELDEIHDVQINNPRQAGQTLIYDATNALWKNARLTAGVGVSITNADSSITISADGGVNYQGTWNASTNTPTLTSSVGTKGFYYVVSVAGSTNLNGVTDWKVGDWAIFNGTAWEKVDTTDQVSSVFGRTGAVVGVSTDYSSVGITNTAIGASNPSTGAFTTLSATGNLTVSGTASVTGQINGSAGYQFRAASGTTYELLRYVGGTNNPGIFTTVNESTKKVTIFASGSLVSGQTLGLGAEGSEALTLGAANATLTGNLTVSGTGVSSFSGRLSISSTTGVGLQTALAVSSSSGLGVFTDYTKTSGTSRTWSLGATGSSSSAGDNAFALYDGTAAAFRFLVTSGGNFLLGTTTDSANGKLQLATHTTSAGGIGFGTDTSLYRVAAGLLGLNGTGSSQTFGIYVAGTQRGTLGCDATSTYLANQTAGGSLVLLSGAGTTALTLDSSQNATFAGTIVAVGNSTFKRSDNTGSIRIIPTSGVSAGSDIESFNASTSAYGRLNTRGTHLQVYTGASANTLALTVDDSQNATFAGTVRTTALGIGTAPNSYYTISGTVTLTGNPNQAFLNAAPTFDSGATGQGNVLWLQGKTAAASYTVAALSGIKIESPSLGAGSSVTTVYGLRIQPQTGGTTNYAIHTDGGYIRFGSLPTSSAGLPSGTVWNDGGTLKIA